MFVAFAALFFLFFFFFTVPATTEIYSLSLHDALPICLIWLDLVASLPLIKERILVIILLLHFLSLMLGSVLVLMLPLLVWLTPDLRRFMIIPMLCVTIFVILVVWFLLRSEERFSRNAE